MKTILTYVGAVLLGCFVGIPIGWMLGKVVKVGIVWLGVPWTILVLIGLILLYGFVHYGVKAEQK